MGFERRNRTWPGEIRLQPTSNGLPVFFDIFDGVEFFNVGNDSLDFRAARNRAAASLPGQFDSQFSEVLARQELVLD